MHDSLPTKVASRLSLPTYFSHLEGNNKKSPPFLNEETA